MIISIYKKKYFEDFLKAFFCVLGFVSSLPLFLDIKNQNFFLKQIIESGKFLYPPITTSLETVHLPIGFFTFSIIILFLLIDIKNKFKTLLIVSLIFLLIILITKDIGFLRSISFALSIIYISLSIILIYLIKNDEKNFKYLNPFFKFYFIGLFLFIICNILSVILAELISTNDYPGLRFHHIFFYEIYQYYVSFNSVILIIFFLSFYILLFNINNKFNLFFSLLLSSSSIILFFCLRKITLIDLFFLFLLSLFIINKLEHFIFKISQNGLRIISVFIFFILILLSFMIINVRQIDSFMSIIVDRLFNIFTFIDEINELGIRELFFGFSKNFGGYSNIFMDLFVRIGFIGLMLLSFTLIMSCYYLFKYFDKRISNIKNDKFINSIKLFYIFIIFMIIMSSLINLDLFVPYYYINLSICLLFFNFVIKYKLNKKF